MHRLIWNFIKALKHSVLNSLGATPYTVSHTTQVRTIRTPVGITVNEDKKYTAIFGYQF